jgi:hypothetical protein
MARGETFPVAVGHVATHDDLRFAHEFHDLRQDVILQFRAEKEISPFDVLHDRLGLKRLRLREELGQSFSLVLKPVVQAVDHVGNPHGARFEKNRPELWKAIQNAAADERGKSHEHGKMKSDDAGRINMIVEVVNRRTGPADVNRDRKPLLAQRFVKREKLWIVQLTISGGAQDHHRRRAKRASPRGLHERLL